MTVVDKMTVHSLVLYSVAICVRYFEFTTGVNVIISHDPHIEQMSR